MKKYLFLLFSLLWISSQLFSNTCDTLIIFSDTCSITSIQIEFCSNNPEGVISIEENTTDIYACKTDSVYIRIIDTSFINEVYWSTGSQAFSESVAPTKPTNYTILIKDEEACETIPTFDIYMDSQYGYEYEFSTSAIEFLECSEIETYQYIASICQGDSIQITVVPAEATFIQWNTGDFVPSVTLYPTESTVYATSIYDSVGVQHYLAVLVHVEDNDSEFCQPTWTQEIEKTEILIYPNPIVDQFAIEIVGLDISTLKIWDLQGQLHLNILNVDTVKEYSLHHVPSGVYILEFRTNRNQIFHKMIVKD